MNAHPWPYVIAGAIMLSYAVAGLFFLRFWIRTRDRLFALFATAFWVLMGERLLLVLSGTETDTLPYIYSVRLVAFLLIILGIADKNRKQRPPRGPC